MHPICRKNNVGKTKEEYRCNSLFADSWTEIVIYKQMTSVKMRQEECESQEHIPECKNNEDLNEREKNL